MLSKFHNFQHSFKIINNESTWFVKDARNFDYIYNSIENSVSLRLKFRNGIFMPKFKLSKRENIVLCLGKYVHSTMR